MNERTNRTSEPNGWQNISETDNEKIRYWEFSIVLFPQEKAVQQVVLKLTERQMHEKSAQIADGLVKHGMAFNGKNANHYFELITRELPSPEELEREIARLSGRR